MDWTQPDGRQRTLVRTGDTWSARGYVLTAVGQGYVLRTPSPEQVTHFDQQGRLSGLVTQGQEISLIRNSAGQVARVIAPWGRLTLSYNDRGLLTELTGPQQSLSYSYDARGLLRRVAGLPGSDTTPTTARVAYLPAAAVRPRFATTWQAALCP